MKRCPNCQKEFADSMRFCQTDGTPLIDVAPTPVENDPFKTVVGGSGAENDPFKTVVGGGFNPLSKDDDILQLPEEPADPMKTMVVSPEEFRKEIESAPPLKSSEPPAPEPPKFNEPSLNPPPFGDLSPQTSAPPSDVFGSSAPKQQTPPPIEPPSESPFGHPPTGSPFQSPFEEQKSSFEPPSPFDQPAPQFDAPKPPPFKEPEPFNPPPNPFEQQQSPFGQPPPQQSPFGQQMNDPFSQPQQQQSPAEWNPPPAPVQSWQDQGLGANTPFQPPAVSGAGGQNQTLAIVSLVLGILSCLCCFSVITGPAGLITGFIAKGKAENEPSVYGGRGLALGGMITGAIGTLIGLAAVIIQIMGGFAGRF